MPHKSVTVARFVPRADRFFDPNSSFDGRLGSIATLHPTVRTSDGMRAGGIMRQYFEGLDHVESSKMTMLDLT
jgi:hypothetical protein